MYCESCRKHTDHKLKQFKAGSTRGLAKGQRKHLKKTKHGYGGKAKFPIKPKKQTKKPTFVAECSVCKKKSYKVVSSRMKKVEITTK